MASSCCDFRSVADGQFTAKRAAKDLKGYRHGRLEPTTRLMRDAITDAELNRGSLLDVGAGIGALTFELLNRGMTHARLAEASAAYVGAIRDEAGRRGCLESIDVVHGDLVDISALLPKADLVTMDRVVCCYPHVEPMLEAALSHAVQGFAFSYPNDRWFVRLVTRLENAMRGGKTAFRTFVHSPARMRAIVEGAGFVQVTHRGTAVWSVDVFRRALPARAS